MMKNLLVLCMAIMLFTTCLNQATKVEGKNETIDKIKALNLAGYEITDLHAHLKGGLGIQELLKHSDTTGIKYGVAVNGGWGFSVQDDSSLSAYYHAMKDYPVYLALQAEGREWVDYFSPDSIALFDYVFTDAMTFFDKAGRRNRLWMKDEVFMENPDSFMEYYITQIETIFSTEPVDIYVNPTYLPDTINHLYDELWTEERIDRLVKVLVENDVALEINCKRNIPSEKILKAAKDAGVLFTFGTNNTDNNLGYLEYGIDMIEALDLKPENFWKPSKKVRG